ncbi:MAG: exodeoxyribonuclease VII small subunit [Bacillota bacterium]|nr:exodeoxyribonuclease VII small subunit [Bacillota bacterium]
MKQPPEPRFEEALAQLEQIVRALEQGNAGLEESLRLFEEGTRLLGVCQRRLDEAEGRMAKLIQGEDGEPDEEPWPGGPGPGESGSGPPAR